MTALAGPRPTTDPGRRRSGPVPMLDASPGRLRLLRAVLVGLGLLLALTSAVTATLALNGTLTVTRSTEPPLVSAETIFSSLADADTTAAQAFLSGGLEPAAQTARYTADGWTVTDPGSTNGTTMNDSMTPLTVSAAVPVTDGDRIHLGAWTTISVHAPPDGD